ncbi:MAG: UPF0146 family protein [Haloarculaceae archaeon]
MQETRDAIADRLAKHDRLVEVGVGNRPDVAAVLAARGARVTATDVGARTVPSGVRFVVDDVTDPDPSVYADADAVYALNCPPELHRPLWSIARRVDAACLFTTLGTDPPAVPVDSETVPGETLYRPHGGPGSRRAGA